MGQQGAGEGDRDCDETWKGSQDILVRFPELWSSYFHASRSSNVMSVYPRNEDTKPAGQTSTEVGGSYELRDPV